MKTPLNLQKAATLAGVSILSASISSMATADDHSEGLTELDSGYQTVAKAEAEGKCGEGKCGEGKCGEGKCGEGKDAEGKCGEGKCGEGKDAEGKCGEGKCGA